MKKLHKVFHAGCAVSVFLLSACSIGYQASSPEVKYSDRSSKALALQVPPDLTDVGDTEQFVVPGTSNTAASRNSLLPVFESVTFERSAQQSWLQVSATPEVVWPKLLEFLRAERIEVAMTQPVTGLIATEWQKASFAPSGSALKNLISNSRKGSFQRIALRLERLGGNSRIFARSQTSERLPPNEASSELLWPSASDDPEQTTLLLQQLLVFFGIEEQRAKGLLDENAEASILDSSTLETTASGFQLVMHQSYPVAFSRLQLVLEEAGVDIRNQSSRTGIVRVEDRRALQNKSNLEYTFSMLPIYTGSVQVTVRNLEGKPLGAALSREILEALVRKLV